MNTKSLQETIRKVLSENNKEILWLRRRLNTPDIIEYMDNAVFDSINNIGPCGYRTSNKYFNVIMEACVENFIFDWEELYNTKDPLPINKFVYEVMADKYGDYIRNIFNGRICN